MNNMYWLWEGVLSKEFCQSSLEQVDWATSITAEVNKNEDNQNSGVIDLATRRTDIIWQDCMQPLGCVAKAYIESANHQAGWGYSITGQEQTQLSRYKSADQGHYDWHMDAGLPENGNQRKLSIVMLLSDPADYEGGELQFKGIEDRKILTKQGSIVVFPSFIEHKVTPVTKGVRYTAVTWVNGPSFK